MDVGEAFNSLSVYAVATPCYSSLRKSPVSARKKVDASHQEQAHVWEFLFFFIFFLSMIHDVQDGSWLGKMGECCE